MMQRRRRKRALRWIGWTVGPLVLVAVVLALIHIDDVVMAQGIAEPGQKIYIDSPLRRVIHDIYVVAGDSVVAGQPLVRLYDGDLSAAVGSAERELQGAEANLEVATAQLNRLREQPTPEELRIAESRVEQARINLTAREQDLRRARHLYLGVRLWSQEELERAETGYDLAEANLKVALETLSLTRRGPSPAQLQQAEAEVRQAAAQLERARQNLEAARASLDLATVRSPVDGVVARRDLHPGMLADQGQIILIVAGGGRGPIISAWMGETNAWKVGLGNSVEILSNLFSDREEFLGAGEVSLIYGYAVHEGGARTFELEVDVQETPIPLRYGSTADLRIIVGRRTILNMLLGIESKEAVRAHQSTGAPSIPARIGPPPIRTPSEPPREALPAAGGGEGSSAPGDTTAAEGVALQ